MKSSSIRSQIRNAILVLAGALILLIIGYLSRALLTLRESDALESLSGISQRDSRTTSNHFFAVERAEQSLIGTLNSIQSETFPAEGTVNEILKLTPEIKRIWIFRKKDKGEWLPWLNFEQQGIKLERSTLPQTKWSIDDNQSTPTISLFEDNIPSKTDFKFRILFSIAADDLYTHSESLGTVSLLYLNQANPSSIGKVKLIGIDPPEMLTEHILHAKQNFENFRLKLNGREYIAFINRIDSDVWMSRWVDLSVLNVSIFETILDTLAILLLFFAVLLISSSFFSKRLSAPFLELMRGTEEIGKGNFNLDLKVSGNEESTKLAFAMNKMATEIKQLIIVERQKSRLESELKAASLIQDNMLPENQISTEHYDIESVYKPAVECSGDWWQCHTVGTRLLLIVADVTGHGVGSALTTAALQACYQGFIARNPNLEGEPESIIKKLLSEINTGVYSIGSGDQNATCIACLLDTKDSSFYFVNCGHPSGFIVDPLSQVIVPLRSTGEILGSSPNMKEESIEPKKIEINSTQILFLYTDGFLDLNLAATPGGRKKVLQQKVIEWSKMSSSDAGQNANEFITKLIGTETPDDDVSLLRVALK